MEVDKEWSLLGVEGSAILRGPSSRVNEERSRRVRWLSAWVPVLAYAGLIFWLSDQPHPPVDLPSWSGSDKVAHAIEYSVLAVLLWRAVGGRNSAGGTGFPACASRARIVFLATAFYAASDEWHQSFVPDRNASVGDWLADTLGGLTVVLLLSVRFGHSRNAVRKKLDGAE